MSDLMIFLLSVLAALATPCAAEDDYSCRWDASTRDNGIGQSFVIGPRSADGDTPRWLVYFD